MQISKPEPVYHNYRPDIDGLRAIAVLGVIAFHAFPDWVSGGFIGVDIFFVISGYFISTIILTNLDCNTFSITQFYIHRIKRIFPSLLLVLITCFFAEYFLLLIEEQKSLGKHIVGGVGFLSNFILLNESGYSDIAAETKPLIHLWSLAIEEQSYIIWPLILLLFHKKRFNILSVIVVLLLVSFLINAKLITSSAVATFYFSHTRFWEILFGAFLAWVLLYWEKKSFIDFRNKSNQLLGTIVYGKNMQPDCNLLPNFLSLIGLFLLAFAYFEMHKELNFPGYWALIPVIGASLIIISEPNCWIKSKLLSNKYVVFLGIISYPLYLWHWPLLSFARIIESENPVISIRIAALLIAIILA